MLGTPPIPATTTESVPPPARPCPAQGEPLPVRDSRRRPAATPLKRSPVASLIRVLSVIQAFTSAITSTDPVRFFIAICPLAFTGTSTRLAIVCPALKFRLLGALPGGEAPAWEAVKVLVAVPFVAGRLRMSGCTPVGGTPLFSVASMTKALATPAPTAPCPRRRLAVPASHRRPAGRHAAA